MINLLERVSCLQGRLPGKARSKSFLPVLLVAALCFIVSQSAALTDTPAANSRAGGQQGWIATPPPRRVAAGEHSLASLFAFLPDGGAGQAKLMGRFASFGITLPGWPATPRATLGQIGCALEASPGSSDFPAISQGDGDLMGTFTVTQNPAGCGNDWKAERTDIWISNPVRDGDKVTFEVETNNGGARSQTIRILLGANLVASHTVNQAGRPVECMYAAVPPNRSFGSDADSFTFTVEAPQGCEWGASVTRGANFVGILDVTATNVTYSVSENTNTGQREGTIEIRGTGPNSNRTAEHTITQSGACAYEAAPASVTKGANEVNGSFTVNTGVGCAWSVAVTAGMNFISIDRTEGGPPGTGTVFYNLTPNPTFESRSGTITVSRAGTPVATHSILQLAGSEDGGTGPCNYTVSPTTARVAAPGGPGSFTVTTSQECEWTPSSNVSWITLTTTRGVGTGPANYTVEANTGPQRTGVITVQGQTHTVTQEARIVDPSDPCMYSVDRAERSFGASGGPGSFNLTTTPANCAWTVTASDESVITNLNPRSGSGNALISYQVRPNAGSSPVRVTITVRGANGRTAEHRIVQEASTCSYTLSPAEIVVGERPGLYGFTVTTDGGAACMLERPTPSVPWITVRDIRAAGAGKSVVIFEVLEGNAGSSERSGDIPIGNATFRVIQDAVGGCAPGDVTTRPPARSIELGKVRYGTLVGGDCSSLRGTALFADRYKFTATAGQRVAINVASDSFDPFIYLLRNDRVLMDGQDDDGAGFSDARIPRLPGADAFITLPEAGEYIVEVTSFGRGGIIGNYAIYITPEGGDPEPVILSVLPERKSLIVVGENFGNNNATLLIRDADDRGFEEQPNTENAPSRSRTALIALTSAKKLKKGPVVLMVQTAGGKLSNVFVHPGTGSQ